MNALSVSLEEKHHGVRSVVVTRDGQTEFDYFRHDIEPDALEEINSITKSVVALAIGMAIDEGVLPGLDTPVATLLPLARDDAFDARVRDITLRHLLTMTSGFEHDPHIVDDCVLGACERFEGNDERMRFILSRPFAHDPGARFAYDSHAVHLLSLALERAAGCPVERYVREKLFAPLGIDQYEWISDEAGHTFAARGLTMRTRDMTKLGALVLARGAGLVSASFIDDAVSPHIDGGPPNEDARYGYLWWIAPDYVFAAGYGEQFIFVAHEQQIVAAITADVTRDDKSMRDWFRINVLGKSET